MCLSNFISYSLQYTSPINNADMLCPQFVRRAERCLCQLIKSFSSGIRTLWVETSHSCLESTFLLLLLFVCVLCENSQVRNGMVPVPETKGGKEPSVSLYRFQVVAMAIYTNSHRCCWEEQTFLQFSFDPVLMGINCMSANISSAWILAYRLSVCPLLLSPVYIRAHVVSFDLCLGGLLQLPKNYCSGWGDLTSSSDDPKEQTPIYLLSYTRAENIIQQLYFWIVPYWHSYNLLLCLIELCCRNMQQTFDLCLRGSLQQAKN